jgi:hypothetical protein
MISSLYDIHQSWIEVAREAGVSYRTLLRRRHQYQLPVAQIRGPRNNFTEISQEHLCDAVTQVLHLLPNAGETFMIGALRSRGIFVQRWRIRKAIYLYRGSSQQGSEAPTSSDQEILQCSLSKCSMVRKGA